MLATFQILNNNIWLVAIVLDSQDIEHSLIIENSIGWHWSTGRVS